MENIKCKPLLGVCPIGKSVFSHDDSLIQKNLIFKKLMEWGISYCDINEILPDGMVSDQHHVDSVVEYFKQNQRKSLI